MMIRNYWSKKEVVQKKKQNFMSNVLKNIMKTGLSASYWGKCVKSQTG